MLQEADHSPVRVGDNLTFTPKSRSGGSGGHRDGGDKPRPPRKTLDERITEAVSKALIPVITRLDEHDKTIKTILTSMNKVEKRLDRMDDILEYNVQTGILKTPK